MEAAQRRRGRPPLVPDAIVHELRELRVHKEMRYQELVAHFEAKGVKLTFRNVRAICTYQRRAKTP